MLGFSTELEQLFPVVYFDRRMRGTSTIGKLSSGYLKGYYNAHYRRTDIYIRLIRSQYNKAHTNTNTFSRILGERLPSEYGHFSLEPLSIQIRYLQ